MLAASGLIPVMAVLFSSSPTADGGFLRALRIPPPMKTTRSDILNSHLFTVASLHYPYIERHSLLIVVKSWDVAQFSL